MNHALPTLKDALPRELRGTENARTHDRTVNASQTDTRPCVAILVNSIAPSRFHLHTRLATALPQYRFLTPILFEVNNIAWPLPPMDHFGGAVLGKGEKLPAKGSLGLAWKGFKKGFRLLQLLRQERVRAIVINGYMYSECWMTLAYAKLRGIPVFLAGDSNAATDITRKGLRGLIKKIVVGTFVRSCAGVMPVGSLGVHYFEKYGAKTHRSFVVTFETDPKLREPLSQERLSALRSRFGFDEGRRRILCSGRFVDVKRFHDAIDAFIAIADQRPDLDLVMAGDGPDRAALEARVPSHLRSRVIWLGMITDPDVVMDLYKGVHLLLHPSGYEPWGMVVQEAAAAGLPVIATGVTGASVDIIREGENGFIVPAGDVKAMSKAILAITDNAKYPEFVRCAKLSTERWHESYESVRGFKAALDFAGVAPRT
ncbi:MAG: glycosyltransferase family 4 protein [Phycisphaerales bacterium]